MRYPVRLLGTLVAILVLAAACGPDDTTRAGPVDPSPKPSRGGILTFVLDFDVVDLDPMRSTNVSDRAVLYQIYDSLVRIDAAGKIIPGLAESWRFSDDSTVVTLNLRQGISYHDGTPFNAASAKWNIDRYRAAGSLRRGDLASIAATEVVDASTIRLKLGAPFPSLLASLVDRAGMMVSKDAVDAAGDDFTRKAFKAGTGPFVLTEAVKDDHVTIERNPKWWGADREGAPLPYLDRVIFKPIVDGGTRLTNVRTGEAQATNRVDGKDVPHVRSDPALTYQEAPGVSFGSLIPNRAPGFTFSEGRYVKAVAMAIDRRQLLETPYAGLGVVGYGAIAPPHFAFDPSFRPYETPDAVGARRLVEAVGKGPLRFELLVQSGDPTLLQTALLIQSQLLKADIVAEVKTLALTEIQKLQAARSFTGLTLYGWSGRLDPDGNVYDMLRTGAVLNDSSYSNAQVDKLLDEQRATSDEARRRAALRAAEQIYVAEDPARIWFRFGTTQLLTAKTVRGLEPYPDGLARLQYAWLRR